MLEVHEARPIHESTTLCMLSVCPQGERGRGVEGVLKGATHLSIRHEINC